MIHTDDRAASLELHMWRVVWRHEDSAPLQCGHKSAYHTNVEPCTFNTSSADVCSSTHSDISNTLHYRHLHTF
jgi:hypothetical protein